MVVIAVLIQQLLMVAHLRDALVGDIQDAVAVLNGGKPVGDDEAGAALQQGVEALLDQALGFGVDGGGRLVQHQDFRVGEQSAGKGHQLPLALGQAEPRSLTWV